MRVFVGHHLVDDLVNVEFDLDLLANEAKSLFDESNCFIQIGLLLAVRVRGLLHSSLEFDGVWDHDTLAH